MPDDIPVDLIEDGVLWLINKVVFHPRGFALAYSSKTKEFSIIGNGTETWHFLNEELDDIKFAAVNALLKRAEELND